MNLLYVPCRDEKESKTIGKKLVEEKLAFCVNIVPKIHSIFREKGNLIEACDESLLLIKSNSPYKNLEKRIKELHSYKTPAIIKIKTKANKDYIKYFES